MVIDLNGMEFDGATFLASHKSISKHVISSSNLACVKLHNFEKQSNKVDDDITLRFGLHVFDWHIH